MPLTKGALSKVDKWLAGVDVAHDSASQTRRTLNLLTFGLATGTAAGAVMGNSAASIQNMALGAGAIYAGTSLFLPNDQISLYNSATAALVCVRGRAAGLRANVETQKSQLPTEDPTLLRNEVFSAGCPLDAASEASFSSAHLAYIGAKGAVEQAELADSVIAAKIEDAAQNVVITLNAQLDLLAPSQEAILASAKSTASIATSLRPQSISVPAPGKAAAAAAAAAIQECRLPPKQTLDMVQARFAAMVSSFDAIQTAITQQVNGIASLSSACTLSPAQFAPVALNNSEVTVTKDSKINVAITGGTGSYFWTAVGSPPPSDLAIDVIGSTLIVTAKATLSPGAQYTITVQDRSAMPKPATLKIITK